MERALRGHPTVRRLTLSVAVVVAAAGAGWVARAQAAPAAGGGPFTGAASAAGVTVTAASEEDATRTTLEASGPNVTAIVSSLPDSEAFAADPYPGPDLLDLLNVLGGSSPVPPPSYPFEASSGYPGRSQSSVTQPGYRLSATSTRTRSHGAGQAGYSAASAEISSAVSDADVISGGGAVVVASASTAARGFSAGPLDISGVESRASATLTASGQTTTSSAISVGTITVNGVPVGLDENGLTLAGTTVPLPPAGPLSSALEQAGVTVSLLGANKTETGVVAPGVAIRMVETDPNGKRATVTYSLGLASASAAPSVQGGGSGPGFDGGGNPTGGWTPPSGPSPGSTTAPAVTAPGGAANLSQPAGTAPVATSGPSSAPIGEGRAPATSAPPPTAPARVSPAATVAGLGGLFYLLLVIAAAATLLAGHTIRLKGVRWARSSG